MPAGGAGGEFAIRHRPRTNITARTRKPVELMQLVGLEFGAGAEIAVHHGETKAKHRKDESRGAPVQGLGHAAPALARVAQHHGSAEASVVTVRWIASLISG